MKLPCKTLSLYITRQFLLCLGMVSALMLGMILLFDTLELLRRASKKSQLDFLTVFQMASMKLPDVGQQILPLAVMFGAMLALWRLTRSQELIVARAAGISAWQFLLPMIVIAFGFGFIKIAAINPVSAILLSRYEQMDNRYLRGRSSGIELSNAGLWLRQSDNSGETIIHAASLEADGTELKKVFVLFFNHDRYMGRVDSPNAVLENGEWRIAGGWLNEPDRAPKEISSFTIATDITPETIADSFAQPDQISFWEMPKYISILEKTGFPSVRTRMHYQALLATPLLYAGMVLVAAVFSLRPPRRGGTLTLIVSGILCGFGLFFLRDLASALGVSETLPVTVAAWIPAMLCLLTGLGALLYLEDG